jgi:hypothetical protein
MITTYTYTISPVSLDRLEKEINDSKDIYVKIDHISALGSSVDIVFLNDLTQAEQDVLSTIVANHSGEPLPEEVTTQPVEIISQPSIEQLPFAQPTYRTKRNATSSLITVPVGGSASIDFQLTAERYVSGGMILAQGAEFGDYATASVYDKDGVIPAPYRAALCENHPIIAQYIEKEWIKVKNSDIAQHEINTYPLNAKISAGLYLRITYFATNAGSDRLIAVNYYLTKKL